jgi:putative transposase
MPRGRPVAPLTLSPPERQELEALTRSRSMPHTLVTRARIVLLAADGRSNTAIGARLGLSKPTVGIWRRRYLTQRVQGLYDELRPGGPRSIPDEAVAVLLRKTLKTKPKDGTHWTCRALAAETRVSKSTVQRVWTAFGLQPHRQKHFKLSTDPLAVSTDHRNIPGEDFTGFEPAQCLPRAAVELACDGIEFRLRCGQRRAPGKVLSQEPVGVLA